MQNEWFDGITGTALKITKTRDGLWAGKPVLNFGYTVKDGEVWYDLSTVNGYDWWGEVLVLDGEREVSLNFTLGCIRWDLGRKRKMGVRCSEDDLLTLYTITGRRDDRLERRAGAESCGTFQGGVGFGVDDLCLRSEKRSIG